MMSEEKLTLKEAAAELRMTTRALRDLCKAGRIGFVRAGRRHWLFTRKDIDEFLERNTYRPKTVYEKPGKSKPQK
jgi:excisionase family DNA binding protein